MKFLVVLLAILISGCASLQPSVGTYHSLKSPIHSESNLYAKLLKDKDGYYFSDICEDRIKPLTGYPKCKSGKTPFRKSIEDPWNSYVALNSLMPAFDTGSNICSTVGFINHYTSKKRTGGYKTPSCVPAEYWESDIAWGEFAQWLFIFPALVMAYYEEVYFDWDKYTKAVEEAERKINRVSILAAADKKYGRGTITLEQERRYAELDRKMQHQKEQERKANEIAQSKVAFSLANSQTEIGGEICSIDNRFGYLERISGSRLQIRIKGRVEDNSKPQYFLFSAASNKNFISILSEEIIWDDQQNWGTCDISSL